jgi:hypothetical protein
MAQLSEMSKTIPLREMQAWVDQYKNDTLPHRLGQTAALAAMEEFLLSWEKGDSSIKTEIKEISRMIEILQAFHGRMAIWDAILNGIPDDD